MMWSIVCIPFITILISEFYGTECQNGSKDLLDKKSILPIIQLLMTAKLFKDNNRLNNHLYDLKTNNMLFLGKGDIRMGHKNL